MTMELRGKSVLIVGFERTGEALARFLVDRGARVRVSDKKPAATFGARLRPFEERGVAFELGGHRPKRSSKRISSCPAPASRPWPRSGPPREGRAGPLRDRAGLALPPGADRRHHRFERKSTTTTLTHAILRDGGLRAHLAGNIGTPLISFADKSRDDDVYVTEISSFQLEYTERFTPAVAAILNVSENHIDWHGSFESYFAAKTKLLRRLGPEGRAVLTATTPGSGGWPPGPGRRSTASAAGAASPAAPSSTTAGSSSGTVGRKRWSPRPGSPCPAPTIWRTSWPPR